MLPSGAAGAANRQRGPACGRFRSYVPRHASLRRVLSACALAAAAGGQASDDGHGIQLGISADVGHPTFASPHANPIVAHGDYVYAVNTPADTVDVIDMGGATVVLRINVGIDPVSLAVRPDGREVWVGNHVSDSVSVIDTDPGSRTFHQVIATVQDIDAATYATNFDEPVGIAFAGNDKAYVALSQTNRVAIVDVASREVTGDLDIKAQDPRALAVHGDRLFVLPFESNNQSQLSGCLEEDIDNDMCTFDAVEHVFTNNNVLSLNYDADIVKNPELPDRDMFVYNTNVDRQLQIVETLGTLLYGIAIDSQGRVFIAQADARNVENGRAGTEGHGLAEMDNRAFLNQVTRVTCGARCGTPAYFDLEPLPPMDPEPGSALATPYGLAVSDDDSTLVVTAAGSARVFTMDADTGAVLGRVDVESTPRGVALVSDGDGAPSEAWILNAVANSVSLVDVSTPASPSVTRTITLSDPTHPTVKRGRIAFNNADASTTGTFSCESCHPDNHTDQLIWVLDTPICDIDGCTQIPPRLTMPAKGLRDTQPYHWDGIPGDPYGGNNTASINANVEPNCSIDNEASCTRFLVDGSLATTMCKTGACPRNDEGKAGALDAADRDALAEYLLAVPFPPAPGRAYDNVLTDLAQHGFFDFSFITDSAEPATGAQTCGACHKMPFLVSTNTPGTGMDAPTWRGAYDRWMVTPQARLNIIDLMQIVNMDTSFPERDMWILAGANAGIWEMVLQGSTGFSGSFSRQVTLNAHTAGDGAQATNHLLRALERSANEGAIRLQGEGLLFDDEGNATPLSLEWSSRRYRGRAEGSRIAYQRQTLMQKAAAGDLVLTLTGRMGSNVGLDDTRPPQQLTLDEDTMRAGDRATTVRLMRTLEKAADAGDIRLHGEGFLFEADGSSVPISVEWRKRRYRDREKGSRTAFLARDLIARAASGELVLTLTAHRIVERNLDQPQPALWPVAPIHAQTRTVEIPFLSNELTLRINARHLKSGANVVVDGRKVAGSVACESGDMPTCDNEIVLVTLTAPPRRGGLHFLQLQNPEGLFSNDMMFFSEQTALSPRRGNLISSGGAFTAGQFRDNWNTVEIAANEISVRDGAVFVDIANSSDDPWHAQISHSVMVVGGQEYCLCYRARASGNRHITAYMDSNMDSWSNISGGQFRAELGTSYQSFRHVFTVEDTDLQARVAFDFAQSSLDVHIDDIGVYEGNRCGRP